MASSLTIENSNRWPDKLYIGLLSAFWIIWAPATAWVTFLAITDFHIFFLLWLPFGYLGVLLVPWIMIQSRKPQVLEATEGMLIFHGNGTPFFNVINIPRCQLFKLHIGHYDNGEGESVVTLNLLYGGADSINRIMISPLSHPLEKRKVFREVEAFLQENGFLLEIQDDHPASKTENGGRGGI